MDLNWLHDFLSVEETRSFTLSADKRNVTQSALSRRVKALESWLGTTLFDRSSFPIRLTPTGEMFLPVARGMLSQLGNARADIQQAEEQTTNTLRVAASHTLASTLLADCLNDLYRDDPNLKLRVYSSNLAVAFDMLSQGACDFVICYRYAPLGEMLDQEQFVLKDIARVRLIPVAERHALAKHKWAFPGSRAAPLPILAYDKESFFAAILAHLFSTKGQRPFFQERHNSNNVSATLSACKTGAGIAWLPDTFIASELDAGELMQLGGGWHAEIELSVFYNRDFDHDLTTRFLDAIGITQD